MEKVMSDLREKVASYFSMLESGREERADEIISAVLDEAIEVVKSEFTGEAYYLDLFTRTIEKLKD